MNPSPAKKPEDQRVRLTKAMLQNAFLQLLAQKPLRKVTVKELCEAAGVNRGTFYLHYQDVYDLLEKMEGELLGELEKILEENPVIRYDTPQEKATAFISSITGFLMKNREMCAILLGENGDKHFLSGIIERGRDKSIKEYLALFPGATRQQVEIFYYYIAWGFIGLLQYSLAHPDAFSPEVMAASAQRIITESSRFFQPESSGG